MANGLPYAIAAQIAYPDRQCVAFVGDGGFTMLMGEFATAVKYKLADQGRHHQEQHASARSNGSRWCFSAIRNMAAICSRSISLDSPTPAAARASRIEDPEECGRCSIAALRTPGPVLIEAVVDPYEPPMPAKVTARQAAHLAESLAKGTPDGRKVMETIFKDKVRELV